MLCTEFGGVNISPSPSSTTTGEKQKDAGNEKDWGYTTAVSAADLLTRFEKLIRAVAGGGVCCGFVYTQLTDIEQEVNGLYTWDRRPKLKAADVKAVIDAARKGWRGKVRIED